MYFLALDYFIDKERSHVKLDDTQFPEIFYLYVSSFCTYLLFEIV